MGGVSSIMKRTLCSRLRCDTVARSSSISWGFGQCLQCKLKVCFIC